MFKYIIKRILIMIPMLLVVNNDVPVSNLSEFVAWAKQQKTGVSWGSAGLGSPHHLVGELFREEVGLGNMTHVPYRGAAPAVQDVIGGQIPAMWADSATIIPFLGEKKLKAIGVASPARIDVLPKVATLQEQGLKGFEGYAWQGVVVPASETAESEGLDVHTSTVGTGTVLAAAVASGERRIVVDLTRATAVDAGAGILAGLGAAADVPLLVRSECI